MSKNPDSDPKSLGHRDRENVGSAIDRNESHWEKGAKALDELF